MTTTFRSRTPAAFALVCAAAAALAVPVRAGPLNPPPGPIAGTYKTLTEVEPRIPVSLATTPGDANSVLRITQPGSYYLTGNVTGVAGKRGIKIEAPGVVLDLSGFALIGVPGSLSGIEAEGCENLEIKNGAVRSWGSIGVDIDKPGTTSCTLRDLRVAANDGEGIRAAPSTLIINCAARGNTYGIVTASGCSVINCAAYANDVDGIACFNASVVIGCTAYDNGGRGIGVSFGGLVTACASYSNADDGITASGGGTISNNTSRANGSNGINATGGCTIIANTCSANGTDPATGAGIRVSSGDSRIEGNNCFGQDRGIDVDSAGNFIVRNTCSGNTVNWEIVANNVFGPIVNRTSPGSGAVSGDAAPSSLGSTDANANYTY